MKNEKRWLIVTNSEPELYHTEGSSLSVLTYY